MAHPPLKSWIASTFVCALLAAAPANRAAADEPTAEPPKAQAATTPAAAEPAKEPGLSFDLHGYYRVRGVWLGNVPLRNGDGTARTPNATFAFQRLRLDPSVSYGFGGDDYQAKITAQVDALDNVVFGDNARNNAVPLFAVDASNTSVLGDDVESIRFRRAWLELMTPVGLVGVGRMALSFGLQTLVHNGNGLSEWGDPLYVDSVDMVFFATQPLTIANALISGDTRPTPMYLFMSYAQLAEDTLVDPQADVGGDPAEPDTRNDTPYRFLAEGRDDVESAVLSIGWDDKKWNHHINDRDVLNVGAYGSYRWQPSTASKVYVADLAWKVRHTPWRGFPTLYSEGEIFTLQGESRGVPFAGGCDENACDRMDANVWGGAFRLGVLEPKRDAWSAILEGGFATGDGKLLGNKHLTERPLHPDYRVGLLMYQVAIYSASAQLGNDARGLWSFGGVYNSRYLNPQVRYSPWRGIEFHVAALFAWADALNPSVYVNERANSQDTSCGAIEGDCFLGWETDAAVRVKWGKDDLLRWDTEFGLMHAGPALHTKGVNFGIGEPWLWTAQTRIAMVF